MDISDRLAVPFQWGAALRGRKVFHPTGVLTTGSLQRTAPANQGLPVPSSKVVARISKAVGMPGAVPDAVGLALRIAPQLHSENPWDVLLVSAGSGPLTRIVGLRPVTSWSSQTLTSLMPLRYQDTNWWVSARITTEIDGRGLSLDDVRDAVRTGGIELQLEQARGTGDFAPLARLTLDEIADSESEADFSFDPVRNTAPGVALYPGWLAGLRKSAYEKSREGRDA